jgi:hypothetical protein
MTEIRTCRCGLCSLTFTATSTSRKIYFNRLHKQKAKDYRRKLKEAVA